MQPFIKESSRPVKESGFQVAALGSTGSIFPEHFSNTVEFFSNDRRYALTYQTAEILEMPEIH